MMSENDTRKRYNRKPGRTLLVKLTDNNFNVNVLQNMTGLESSHLTEKSNSYFLTFDTTDNSLEALKMLKREHRNMVKVKFAHYRVFFTMQGLNETSDYNGIKTIHSELIQNSTKANSMCSSMRGSCVYVWCCTHSFIDMSDLTMVKRRRNMEKVPVY